MLLEARWRHYERSGKLRRRSALRCREGQGFVAPKQPISRLREKSPLREWDVDSAGKGGVWDLGSWSHARARVPAGTRDDGDDVRTRWGRVSIFEMAIRGFFLWAFVFLWGSGAGCGCRFKTGALQGALSIASFAFLYEVQVVRWHSRVVGARVRPARSSSPLNGPANLVDKLEVLAAKSQVVSGHW